MKLSDGQNTKKKRLTSITRFIVDEGVDEGVDLFFAGGRAAYVSKLVN